MGSVKVVDKIDGPLELDLLVLGEEQFGSFFSESTVLKKCMQQIWGGNLLPIMVTITSRRLGTVEGISKEGVNAFLGLRYATLQDKFAAPVMAEGSVDGNIDAKSFG